MHYASLDAHLSHFFLWQAYYRSWTCGRHPFSLTGLFRLRHGRLWQIWHATLYVVQWEACVSSNLMHSRSHVQYWCVLGVASVYGTQNARNYSGVFHFTKKLSWNPNLERSDYRKLPNFSLPLIFTLLNSDTLWLSQQTWEYLTIQTKAGFEYVLTKQEFKPIEQVLKLGSLR